MRCLSKRILRHCLLYPRVAAGISVEDAKQAFEVAVQNGGKPVHPPSVLNSSDGQESVMAEVHMYGDVVMRFMSGTFKVSISAYCERACISA